MAVLTEGLVEDFIPVVRYHGLNTNKNIKVGGSATVDLSESTGTFKFPTGVTSGLKRAVTRGSSSTHTLLVGDSGMVFVAMLGSSTQTYTLPSVATAGVEFTFVCGHASGEILVTTAGTDPLVITTLTSVGSDIDSAIVSVTTGIKNTAATNAIGDTLTIVSDGVTWFGLGITSGIWATQ